MKETFPRGSEQMAIREAERIFGFRERTSVSRVEDPGGLAALGAGFAAGLFSLSRYNLGGVVAEAIKSSSEYSALVTPLTSLIEGGLNLSYVLMTGSTFESVYMLLLRRATIRAKLWETAFAVQRLNLSVLS